MPFSSLSASSLDLEGNEPIKSVQLEGMVMDALDPGPFHILSSI
jgi:hypothetical protein